MRDLHPAMRASGRAELERARAASDARSLSERLEDAIAWYLVTVAEIARQSADTEDMTRRLCRDNGMPSLRERWEAIHGRRP